MSFQKLCNRCAGTGCSPDFTADFYQPTCSWCRGRGVIMTDENGVEYKNDLRIGMKLDTAILHKDIAKPFGKRRNKPNVNI